jgi:YaiO family outer membrane protein
MPLPNSMCASWPETLTAVALAGCLWAEAAPARASDVAWQVTPRIEHSEVKVNGNEGQWDVWGVAVARGTGSGERVEAAVARHDRNGLVDDELQLTVDTRAGAWGAVAAIQLSTDADFLPEWGYRLQLDRAAGANRRAGVGYRRLQFAASSVNLGSAHMTFYRGDDELGIEYRLGRNAALDHDIRVLQVRASMLRGRNRVGVYLARGDYLFDALGIPGGNGSGWSANFAFARTITPSTTLRWELGAGGETDTFRQRSIALSLQYSP